RPRRIRRNRNTKVDRRRWEMEASRHHANDGASNAIDDNRSTDDVAVPAESLLPERMPHHREAVAARLILTLEERSTQFGTNPEHIEESTGDFGLNQSGRIQ